MNKLNTFFIIISLSLYPNLHAGKKSTILSKLESAAEVCSYCNTTSNIPFNLITHTKDGKKKTCCFNCAMLHIFPRQQKAKL